MKKPETAVTRGATSVTPKPGEPLLSGNDQDSGTVQNVQLLGIDLGTSRSSIVSMNGSRRTIDSYVGWPTDAVSRKLFKSEVVFGRTAPSTIAWRWTSTGRWSEVSSRAPMGRPAGRVRTTGGIWRRRHFCSSIW